MPSRRWQQGDELSSYVHAKSPDPLVFEFDDHYLPVVETVDTDRALAESCGFMQSPTAESFAIAQSANWRGRHGSRTIAMIFYLVVSCLPPDACANFLSLGSSHEQGTDGSAAILVAGGSAVTWHLPPHTDAVNGSSVFTSDLVFQQMCSDNGQIHFGRAYITPPLQLESSAVALPARMPTTCTTAIPSNPSN
ncbi:hypothetical protein F442_18887 [Phytophthora nicotianae P10297]|uniref:Uncharacterized protein n=1 Tax=Phytophthora nicotianae P10297 TaxID=1317064 RepID=W2YBH4_PHYNI|nr:hypothetical protein F442_18887 [Phytophthora nicotianae P10297]